MTQWPSEQFKRALAARDRRNGSGDLRSQPAAGRGGALDASGAASAGPERTSDFDDLVQVGAYLDGRLNGPEREAFLQALSTSPDERADVISAAALIADLDTRAEKVPAELLTRARSAFGNQPRSPWDVLRKLLDRSPAAGFAVAALALLIVLPVGLLLFNGRLDRPFESPSRSLDAPAPLRLDKIAPGLPATAPEPTLQFDLKTETNVRQSSDSARSEQGSCENGISETTDADRAAMRAEKSARSAVQRLPCSRPSSKPPDTHQRETGSPPTALGPVTPAPAPSSVLPTR